MPLMASDGLGWPLDQASDANTVKVYIATQMRESYEREQERAQAKVQQKQTASLSLAEQLGRWRSVSAETKLAEGFERLQTALGVRSVEEAVEKVTRGPTWRTPLIASDRL